MADRCKQFPFDETFTSDPGQEYFPATVHPPEPTSCVVSKLNPTILFDVFKDFNWNKSRGANQVPFFFSMRGPAVLRQRNEAYIAKQNTIPPKS